MKEEIENKLKENIKYILSKETLDYQDVMILKDELFKIYQDENKETNDKQREEVIENMVKLMMK